MKPTARTCNREVQKFTNTSYDILLEIYNNTDFFKDLYETLNPAYYVDFTAGLDGWAATEGTGTLSYNSGITTSFGGDFYKNNLSIDAEKNKFIVLMFELDTPVNISGSVELTYADGTTFDYVNTINYVNGVTGTIINLEQNPNHKGTVTGIRFKLGSNPSREYRLFKSFVGKPLLSINNLVNLESEILNLISRQNLTDSILTALNSRTDALEEKPFLSIKPETLDESFDKYEVTGISVNGVSKKVTFKDDVIELVNSNGSSYFKLNISDNTYEFKGRLVLSDGTVVDDISDIRALDGDYQEFRFTRSATQPSIESNNPVPPNYSLEPPPGSDPIWFTISKKTSTGELISSWSTPAKLTGENGTSGVAPDTILAYLTSENYIAISNSDGTNPNLSAAGGEFVLTKNGVKVTSGVSYSGGVTKNGLSLIINPSNGLFNLSGSNWSTDVEFFDLTATFEGKNYTKRYSVVKQKGGTNTLTLLLYKSTVRAATSLAGPTGPVTFNLSTLSLSEDSVDALNGWSLLVPEDTLPKRWVTQALITTTSSTTQIQPSHWSTPRVFSIDGVDGEDGSGGSGEAYPGAERKGGTYASFNWNTTGEDSATSRWGTLTGRSPVAGDVFIQVNSSTGATEVRSYNGTAWVMPEAVYESLVTFGDISGEQILAGSVIRAPVIRGGSIELVGNTASSFIKISRNDPFGPNNLIEWYGPKINGTTWNAAQNAPIYSGMTKANAITYYGADGTWYTSGSILAGTFRNSARTSLLTAAPSIELGPFGSNGGLLTIKVSFGASRGELGSGPCPAGSNPSGTLFLDKWIGTQWVQVASQVMTGEYSCSQEGREYIASWWLSGSFTFTDSEQSTANRRFRARATHNTPLLPNGNLDLSIISEE